MMKISLRKMATQITLLKVFICKQTKQLIQFFNKKIKSLIIK